MKPLAERMRPARIEDLIGQQKLLGPNAPLARALKAGRLPSLILWGPPGVGKTTLARLLASELNRPFQTLSAVRDGVKEVRAALDFGKANAGTILFIDEIHRFNKSQQDALLQGVEDGTVTLVGATTENPSFEVVSALLSRCQVFVLEEFSPEEMRQLLQRAIEQDEILKQKTIRLDEWGALYQLSGGDGRKALNLLELLVEQYPLDGAEIMVTDAAVMETAQRKIAVYDKSGEQHYDIISAFIKSMRGGDPNGALYWLARMLEGGEDVRFIARRMLILASEDVGNANPNALLLANACFQAVDVIGMPEARIILAQCATYLATSVKSNASYGGIGAALEAVRKQPNTPVPLHLRNAPTRLMKNLNYGKDYKYTHSYEGRDGNQEYLPAGLEGTTFYRPKEIGKEKEIAQYLRNKWGEKYGY